MQFLACKTMTVHVQQCAEVVPGLAVERALGILGSARERLACGPDEDFLYREHGHNGNQVVLERRPDNADEDAREGRRHGQGRHVCSAQSL